MKVAHLTTVDLSLRYLVWPQLLAVIEEGGEVVGISAPGQWVNDLEQARVRHVPLQSSTRSMNPLADLRSVWQLWRILRHEKPDILHTHNPKPGIYGRLVGRLAGVPIVVNTVHGLYATPDDPPGWRALVYFLEWIASRFSDAELVQSREDLELMRRWRIAPREKLRHLGNGVDLLRFDPGRFDESDCERIRRDLDVGSHEFLIGVVGRLVEEKGYIELFEAARHLDSRCTLICVGPRDPDKEDALRQQTLAEAEAAGVIFTGMRTDIDELYAALDLFVLPSHREGFPRAAMEAAAMGLPVIATDIRGCREVVEDGVNGRLVPVRDPAALAEAIGELIESPARREEMGKASRRKALSEFDERRVVDVIMETYRELSRSKGVDQFGGVERDSIEVRDAVRSDVQALAGLHIRSITSGFLPSLGQGFMRVLYRALVSDEDAAVLVADDGEGVVGFVAGVTDTGAFYRRFMRRWAVVAALSALPRLLRLSVVRRAIETLRYGGGDRQSGAELLSMAVGSSARGRGLATKLGDRFLQRMADRGVDRVGVVVGADNHAALATYRRLGFGDERPIQVHARDPSVELTWRA